jgi:hypothetical protein
MQSRHKAARRRMMPYFGIGLLYVDRAEIKPSHKSNNSKGFDERFRLIVKLNS